MILSIQRASNGRNNEKNNLRNYRHDDLIPTKIYIQKNIQRG